MKKAICRGKEENGKKKRREERKRERRGKEEEGKEEKEKEKWCSGKQETNTYSWERLEKIVSGFCFFFIIFLSFSLD